MKKLIFPVLMGIVGVSGGAAAGFYFKTTHKIEDTDTGVHETAVAAEHDTEHEQTDTTTHANADVEYAKLNNQFVVPVVAGGKMEAMIILGLSVEIPAGQQEALFELEPKLRDALFSTMLNHANLGGFSGDFTSPSMMRALRESLDQTAQSVAPGLARSVLILEIARQDM